ncbi:MAG TPA: nucleotidyltransferase family protein [Vicinamibacterales bacterium]|nr:nucleotidyltransferase family protein [Vicinamibacterales bacterium]
MTCGIVLAAGLSSRMGRPKALLKHVPSGRTFVGHLVRSARQAGVAAVLVVGRPADDRLRLAAEGEGATFVGNPRAQEGQLSSLLAGLDAAAGNPDVDAVLVMPVDLALVSTAVIGRLLDRAAQSDAVILRAVHGGRHGHPVLFKRPVFEELRRADPALGARGVVRSDPARVEDVEVGDPGATVDIDTPADYERAFGRKL